MDRVRASLPLLEEVAELSVDLSRQFLQAEGEILASVTAVDDRHEMVILDPNYPSFEAGWVRAITVDVDLSSILPGVWFFLVKADIPTQEIGELYFYE